MIRPQITKQISLQCCCVVIMQFVHRRVDKGDVLWAEFLDYLEEFHYMTKEKLSHPSKQCRLQLPGALGHKGVKKQSQASKSREPGVDVGSETRLWTLLEGFAPAPAFPAGPEGPLVMDNTHPQQEMSTNPRLSSPCQETLGEEELPGMHKSQSF